MIYNKTAISKYIYKIYVCNYIIRYTKRTCYHQNNYNNNIAHVHV